MESFKCPKCGNKDLLLEENGYWGEITDTMKLRVRCHRCGWKGFADVSVHELREVW